MQLPLDVLLPLVERPREALVFAPAVEGLFTRGLRGRLTPQLLSRLRAVGLDLEKPLLPAYSFACWIDACGIAAEEIFPDLEAPTAWHQLGRLLVTGYRETLLGRALLNLMKVIGPRRTLQRTRHNFSTSSNYIEAELTELSPTHFTLRINEVGPRPEFTQGTLAAGLEESGARSPTVEIREHDGHAALYQIRWS